MQVIVPKLFHTFGINGFIAVINIGNHWHNQVDDKQVICITEETRFVELDILSNRKKENNRMHRINLYKENEEEGEGGRVGTQYQPPRWPSHGSIRSEIGQAVRTGSLLLPWLK